MHRSVIDAIGNTPLIRLKRASEETGCEILGKAEFMNPGQSVKDRAGLFIIRDAEAEGAAAARRRDRRRHGRQHRHRPRVVANALGYRTVIVIPDTQSQEKKDTLRLLGAELIEVPAVPYKNPNNYVKVSGRLAEQLAQERAERRDLGQPVRQRRQPRRPYPDHGQEIWEQTGGKVDGFVSAVGTGGTLAGVAIGLKAKSKDVKIALADPLGAALYSYYTDRRAEGRGHLDHRRHRPGPHHRQSRRVRAGLRLPDPGRGGAADRLRSGPGGRAVPRRLDRHQHRRRDPPGARAWAGPHHRDHPLRLRHALSVEAVQSGIPALEEPAGAGLDGRRSRDFGAVREGRLMALYDRSAVPRRRLSRRSRATVVAINERGGIILDRTMFYATSGGQPGDTGVFEPRRRQPHRDRRDDHRRDQGRDHPCAGAGQAVPDGRRDR